MNNKDVFAKNLKRYMLLKNKNRRQVCNDLGLSYYTFSDWVNGKKYPRMDKVELLADYFGVLKSDLIEDKGEERIEEIIKNDTLADIVIKLRTDDKFLEATTMLYHLDSEQMDSIIGMLKAFVK